MSVRTCVTLAPGCVGQALLEGVGLLAVLAVLWWGTQWLEVWQSRAAHASVGARHAVFTLAAGAPFTHLSGWPAAQTSPSTDVAPINPVLSRDYMTQPRWLLSQAELPAPPAPAWLMPVARPVRASLALLTGHGAADSDHATQVRIGAARHAWRAAADPSMRRASQLDRVMRRVDAPWRSSHDESAWLRRWAGQSPTVSRSMRGANDAR